MSGRRRYAAALGLLVVLAACAGELSTPGEALRLLSPNMEEAFVGEPYSESLRPAGGLRPYTFELTAGTLPPGLALDGGAVRGTPTSVGTYTFTITVSDANLSSTFLEHTLRVREVPPPGLTVSMPSTEVRAPVTVRVNVAEARELAGLRTRVQWDAAAFSLVEGSVSPQAQNVALFSAAGDDWLQVDMAWLAAHQSGERLLFTFQLAPLDLAVPGLILETEFSSNTAQGLTFESTRAGARFTPPRAAQPRPEAAEPSDDEAAAPEGDAPEDEEADTEPPADGDAGQDDDGSDQAPGSDNGQDDGEQDDEDDDEQDEDDGNGQDGENDDGQDDGNGTEETP